MKKERVLNWLYLSGGFGIWAGMIHQNWKIYSTQSAEDISLLLSAFVVYEICSHMPRVFNSRFWVWKVAHIVGISLAIPMLIGVLIYG